VTPVAVRHTEDTSMKRGIWAFYQLNPSMSEPARSAVALIA
jgi:hypothetical protein